MGQSLSEPVTTKETSLRRSGNLLIASSAMQGWRPRMEDAHSVHARLPHPAAAAADAGRSTPAHLAYAGIFDGHGGAKVARYAAEHLHRRLAAAASPASWGSPADLVDPMRAAFLGLDQELRTRRADGGAGSTALTLLVTDSAVQCACLGDSRAVACLSGRPFLLSRDHRPALESERVRILAAGGRVVRGRVNGRLALSRALGDFDFKRSLKRPPCEQMVVANPDISVHQVTEETEFIVMASDGVWDSMTNQEVVSFVRSRLARGVNLDLICEKLLDHCLAADKHNGRTGYDNMTVIVVGFLHGSGVAGLCDTCSKPPAPVAASTANY